MPANRGNALPRGSKLQGGRYVIDGTLGEGAFGITYRATDTRLNRTVAIKELYPGGSQRKGNTVAVPAGYTRDRWQKSVLGFLHEAQTIANLEHPAIVAVYDQFEENNTAYMVMRFIDGANLMQLAQQRGGRSPEADVLRYIAEVGEALSVLHASGILHRDVKPSNIIVNRSGHAVLVDFGAARAFVPDQTLTHSVVLTPGFAPPEQFQPRARRGPTTDIYALAATCYYLLTSNLPDIMDDGRLDDPHLSPRLRAALEHALAYTPAARPQTVAAFLAELQGRTAVPSPPAKEASPAAPTLPNQPRPATAPDATAADRQYQRNLVGDETIVERGQQRNLAADETFVGRSQQRGYTPPPLYPLPADEYIIEQPRRSSALPIIAGSLAAGVLLAALAVLLLGGRGSAGGSGTATPVVAFTTSTSLLAAATQSPVVIAIVPPTDTPLPTATTIPPSPTSAPTDTPVPATNTTIPPFVSTIAPLAPMGTAGADVSVTANQMLLDKGNSSPPTLVTAVSLTGVETSATFLTPPTHAPLAFSDLAPHFSGSVPPGAKVDIEVRFSSDGQTFGDWQPASFEQVADLERDKAGEFYASLVSVPPTTNADGSTTSVQAQYAQAQLHLSAGVAGQGPSVTQFTFAFIDVPPSSAQPNVSSYPSVAGRPVLVKRSDWGAPTNTVNWPPIYAPVSHIIIHHSGSGASSDWAAQVRALWYYDTQVRGWGDISYNYLIDPNGVIYEGRAGGPDVAGSHTYPFNYGSVGIALLGNYQYTTPPQPMLDSLAKLLAWQAQHDGIDPQGVSELDGALACGLSVNNSRPNIAPASDYAVSGCGQDFNQSVSPGQNVIASLPALRKSVTAALTIVTVVVP